MTSHILYIFALILWGLTTQAHSDSTIDGSSDTSLVERVAESAVEINPWDITSEGMDALATAIGDARVVMLGEAWHGDGGAIRLRAALMRFLHERLDFDVLVFEADFYSLNRGWQAVLEGADPSTMATQNVYPFWSTSEAAEPIWGYIEAQLERQDTLHVAGIDPRHIGDIAKKTLPEAMREHLMAGVPGATKDEVTSFTDVLKRFLADEWEFEPTAAEKENFFRLLARLHRHLEDKNKSSFWQQEAENLANFAHYAWLDASRDRAMGDNFAWLVTEQYPGEKIIVWAHNNHLITNKWMYFDSPYARKHKRSDRPNEWFYFGEAVYALFGDQVYVIATVPYTGTYSAQISPALYGQEADFDVVRTLAPAENGTLEATLAHAGHKIAFVNLRPFRCESEAVAARILDYAYSDALRMRYWEGYDGLVFIHTTFGLDEQPPKAWEEQKEEAKKQSQVAVQHTP